MPGYVFKLYLSQKEFYLFEAYIYIYNTLTYMICINDISVDCEWGDWVEGDCSTTCGTGQQNNTRTMLVEEAHGGNCTGGYSNITSCIVVECPGMYLSGIFNKKHSAYFMCTTYTDSPL